MMAVELRAATYGFELNVGHAANPAKILRVEPKKSTRAALIRPVGR